MKFPSSVKFVDERLKLEYGLLEKGDAAERELSKWLARAFGNLQENAFCGVQIMKRTIPKNYLKKYRVNNLWKYDLPRGWRLLYSVEGDGKILVSVILKWLNHKEYEREFGY